jgi:hypothetical protein
MIKNSLSINIKKQTLAELKSLVPHRETDSINTIIEKIIDNFKVIAEKK